MDKAIRQLVSIIVIACLFISARTVHAQAQVNFAKHTVAIGYIYETRVAEGIALSPTDGASYYAITNISDKGFVKIASVVALPADVDTQNWRLDQAIDLFLVAFNDDLSVRDRDNEKFLEITRGIFSDIPPSPNRQQNGTEGGFDEDTNKPLLPYKPGTFVYIGPSGVHNAGYGMTGWKAVDLVSGSDFGSSAATDDVFASTSDEITYVCRDSTSVAIRAGNFIYAHLVDNTFLQEGNNLVRGTRFATLKHGTFSDTCGWANQQPNHYHLHFGMPGLQVIQFSGWNFYPYDGVFVRGNERVGTGQRLINPGVTNEDVEVSDPYADLREGKSIWDGIVSAIVEIANNAISTFPARSQQNNQDIIMQSAGAIMRVFFIILSSSFNLNVFAFVVITMLILEPSRLLYKLYMTIKKAIPFL